MPVIEPVQLSDKAPRRISSVDDFGPEMGKEFDFAAKHDILYPLTRIVADLLPFGTFLFPSGRKQFKEASIGGKALTIGLDAMVFLPPAWIGKGLKVASKPLRTALSKAKVKNPFRLQKVFEQPPAVLDNLERQLDKFIPMTKRKGLIVKYKVTSTAELEAAELGSKVVWEPLGRSGGRLPATFTSKEFQKLFTKKGFLQAKVKKDFAKWSLPKNIQKLNHQEKLYKKFIGQHINKKDYSFDDVFKSQMGRLYGEKVAQQVTFSNIGAKDFRKLHHAVLDGMLNKGRIRRGMDLSSYHYFTPIRKAYESVNPALQAVSRVYKPTTKIFGKAKKAEELLLQKFNIGLASRGLGLINKKGLFVRSFTSAEWKKSGELLVKMDSAQGRGEVPGG